MALKFTDPEKHILTTKAGISRQLIAAWEAGTCNPNKDNALIVADYTGRDLVDVLYGRNPEEKNGRASANG
jgi:transcriptional regulator with XRE-family HTH domain